ncbi:MAG: YCF48-related protein [Patescibacteria group bacterium]|jgi:photosystem II stability/assembly factor-like uncharacterized protein
MRKSLTLFGMAAAVLIFAGAGCISIGSTTSSLGDGGIYKSTNKGDAWAQKNAMPTITGERRNFNGASVATIVQDPQDPNALYIGTTEQGLYFTYDGGESWYQPGAVSRGRVSSIAVHPKDKCIIYATSENKLLRTDDCSRTFTVPFTDTRTDKRIKAVAIDHYDPNVVWIATSAGDLLKSVDGGNYWDNIKIFNNDDIMRIYVSGADSRRVYVATKSNGIWRTTDGGAKWDDLSQKYKDFSGAREFSDLAFGVSDPKIMILASKYGLIRSADGGDTWQKIDLLTAPGSVSIYSLAIDPKDPNVIYYGTATNFYKTANGGANWNTKRLPTSRAATVLHIDERNSAVLYLGVTKFKQ